MTSPVRSALPADLAKVRTLVDAWRATASPHGRLPEALWPPIMDLLATYSIREVSRALDLDSERLRRRRRTLASAPAPTPQPQTQFLELVVPEAPAAHSRRTPSSEIALCLERQDGLRVTVTLPADAWARVEALVCALCSTR